MAEQKIQAGKTIDAVTKRELHDALGAHLRSWAAETAIGGRHVRFAIQGQAAADKSFNMGGHLGHEVGPAPGFIWDMRRLHITGLNSADQINIYMNDVNPSSIVASTTDLGDPYLVRTFTWSGQVVLYPGDSLRFNAASISSTSVVTVCGQAFELPVTLAWKLT